MAEGRSSAERMEPAGNPVLEAILERGEYLQLRDFAGGRETLERVRDCIFGGVAALRGADTGQALATRGLTHLHELLPPEQIGALRDHVMPRIRSDLFALTCGIARNVLRLTGEFFVDDYTILRINYPYTVAVRSPLQAENPGIGRVSDYARRTAAATKTSDPVYDPRAYHRNEPPPAWAHGPHLDTWTGHSRHGINLWWAIDTVLEENSMIFYPEMFGRPLAADPRSLYLGAGFPLPRPRKMAMSPGEMLVFNPEMLHGTHLNTTDFTRLAVSTRINPFRPRFSPSCFYAREFWHSSENLERGAFDAVIRFVREENFEDAADAPPPPEPICHPQVTLTTPLEAGRWSTVCRSEQVPVGGKLLVTAGDAQIVILRTAGGVHAVAAACPHLGIGMLDGFHDERTIYCPAHAVAFDLASGRSTCAFLTLGIYQVRECDGLLLVKPGAKRKSATQPATTHCDPSFQSQSK